MSKIEFRTQILLVNAAIIAGLVLEYSLAAPLLSTFVAGTALLSIANLIFLARWQRGKRIS